MLLTYAGGVVFTALVTIPNWPVYNRNPLSWLDSSEAEKHPKPLAANFSSKKRKRLQKIDPEDSERSKEI
ncbi:putative signal peptidase complex subunit 1 [Nicotiana attenuata]|uniref:Signal peptidase complex subunit 1 n=1 Tax=Nicotiana attenuata TaxID=49451 RepID=A0A1J6JYL2_NICAT|nr:putative signal peptidase complex subunit 1 [Nicotiana attenuata]